MNVPLAFTILSSLWLIAHVFFYKDVIKEHKYIHYAWISNCVFIFRQNNFFTVMCYKLFELNKNKLSKKVLINLGVKSKNIFNTGSLAVEAINKLNFLTKNSLEKKFNFKFLQKNILITYHTETLFKKNHIADLQKIFSALRKFPNIKKIFTASNADEGGNKINNEIKKFTSNKRNNAIFIPNLGNLNYLSILRHVDGVIGNSSSGLYEVPSFKKPTINLGYRQKGRLMSKSVISIAINEKLIIGAIKKIYNTNFIKKIKKSSNPYEGKNTAKKITKILERKSFSSL